jgi:hypothetical protein
MHQAVLHVVSALAMKQAMVPLYCNMHNDCTSKCRLRYIRRTNQMFADLQLDTAGEATHAGSKHVSLHTVWFMLM